MTVHPSPSHQRCLLAIGLLGRHKCLAIVAIIFCFGLGHNKVVLIRLKNANEYEYATQMDRM
jgi:hypothetical protein